MQIKGGKEGILCRFFVLPESQLIKGV